MAQSTAGVKLYYGESTVTLGVPAIPTSWTEIPDITGIPSLSASPSQLETTTLAETTYKTYIDGLIDLGGSFEFTANMTSALVSAVNAAATAPTTGKVRAFSVAFPAPVATRWWWVGKTQAVVPGEVSVDSVLTTTVYISQETKLTAVATS